jgi:hypothetical protein
VTQVSTGKIAAGSGERAQTCRQSSFFGPPGNLAFIWPKHYRHDHHKGKMIPGGRWENVIANDFEELRKVGLGNPQMAKIEARLGMAQQ